jgi:hypothetical protein
MLGIHNLTLLNGMTPRITWTSYANIIFSFVGGGNCVVNVDDAILPTVAVVCIYLI